MDEAVERLELLRRVLLDVEAQPFSSLEASGVTELLRFNLQKVLESMMQGADRARRITRTVVDAQAPGLAQVASPMAEAKLGTLGRLVGERGALSLWLHRFVLSPILAEENRLLLKSGGRELLATGLLRGYLDRTANAFRFSAWEVVGLRSMSELPEATVAETT